MLPLNNIKVLIPRPVGKAKEFSEKLVELGATPIVFPLIEIKAINSKKLKTVFENNTYDWIIFTSTVAVNIFFKTIKPSSIKSKVAAVGTATQKELEQLGLKVSFTPSAATAKKLAKEIPLNKGEKVLMPRSEIAGRKIIDILEKGGVDVTDIATYSNTPVNYNKKDVEQVFSQNINVIGFTSPSTVENFVALTRKFKIKLSTPHIVSIGPSTTAAIKKLQLKADATAQEHNINGLIEAIKSLY